jgi:hypothetical protein
VQVGDVFAELCLGLTIVAIVFALMCRGGGIAGEEEQLPRFISANGRRR